NKLNKILYYISCKQKSKKYRSTNRKNLSRFCSQIPVIFLCHPDCCQLYGKIYNQRVMCPLEGQRSSLITGPDRKTPGCQKHITHAHYHSIRKSEQPSKYRQTKTIGSITCRFAPAGFPAFFQNPEYQIARQTSDAIGNHIVHICQPSGKQKLNHLDSKRQKH